MTGLSKASQRELARATLGRIPAFSRCAGSTLDGFVKDGTVRHFRRGESISHRGGPVASLCVLATGSVEISVTAITGRRHVLHYLESGQLFNIIGAIDGGPGIHDAVAHEDTLALLIPRDVVLTAIETEPHLAMAMIQIFCVRSRALYDYVAEHTLLPLRSRCARLLLSLAEPYGTSRPQGYLITLKLSQEEFADMLGRSRQSVNKELRTLESEGLIKTNYSQFTILNFPSLQAVAEGR